MDTRNNRHTKTLSKPIPFKGDKPQLGYSTYVAAMIVTDPLKVIKYNRSHLQ